MDEDFGGESHGKQRQRGFSGIRLEKLSALAAEGRGVPGAETRLLFTLPVGDNYLERRAGSSVWF